ncbi:DUF6768 family protein [Actibacterium sp. 188UL27-1]|uniref:DUF6768 family protein n=1 Tax=Actibacterium sp. 188UL27-1 TaxID=2786961 RepID=UPI001956F241|nr:DUF6768 family protein [Actibacterium sp. 188UL27-1]MBM7069300.1 hypothetical protein [Actibacterium sp. 188UL27-1]
MTDPETSKLDRMIAEALKGQDREVLKDTQELGYFALGLSQFSGRLGWVTWVIMTFQTAMFLGAIWCSIRFFGATEVLPALKWGLSCGVLLLTALQLKLSLAPQMQADRVIREIKRLELLVASRN